MSAAADTRARRELFQRAVREGVSMDEATRRNAAERWAKATDRLGIKAASATEAEGERQLAWWQQ